MKGWMPRDGYLLVDPIKSSPVSSVGGSVALPAGAPWEFPAVYAVGQPPILAGDGATGQLWDEGL
jgi:hypothetical protein